MRTLSICTLAGALCVCAAAPAGAIDFSLSAIQTQAEKQALGIIIKELPTPEDERRLFGTEISILSIPAIDISVAGGDAFSHIRVSESITIHDVPDFDSASCRRINPGPFECWLWTPMFQTYGAYESDTDFGDMAVVWGGGIVPIGYHPDIGGRPFGYGGNKAGLFLEIGEKLTDPTLAQGGKLDETHSLANSPIYRAHLDVECAIGLYPFAPTYCSHEPDVPGGQRLFLQTQLSAWYDFRSGRTAPQVTGMVTYLFKDKYETSVSLGYQYGSGPPTFNYEGEFKVNFNTHFFDKIFQNGK